MCLCSKYMLVQAKFRWKTTVFGISALSAWLSLATQEAHTNCVIVVMFEFEVNRCISLYKTLFSFSFRKSTSMRTKRVH